MMKSLLLLLCIISVFMRQVEAEVGDAIDFTDIQGSFSVEEHEPAGRSGLAVGNPQDTVTNVVTRGPYSNSKFDHPPTASSGPSIRRVPAGLACNSNTEVPVCLLFFNYYCAFVLKWKG